jgi:hypothetical protein
MSKISYCSLEEAWGDDFVKLKKEKYNEEVENNKTEYNPQLMPLNSSNEINNIQSNQSNQSNQFNQNSKINNNLDTYNNINQEIVDTSNRLNVLDIVNSDSKISGNNVNKNINNDILSEMIESFQNNKQDEIKEHFGNYKTDIFELIILIIIGLIIIFVLDSVYKIGKSVGLKMRV